MPHFFKPQAKILYTGLGGLAKPLQAGEILQFGQLEQSDLLDLLDPFDQLSQVGQASQTALPSRAGGPNHNSAQPVQPAQILQTGQIYLCGHSTSSLDVAWQLEKQDPLPAWNSILCLTQSSGRGQLRRHWHSPPGNIYAALKLPPALKGDSASLLVAFLLVKALQNILEKVETKSKNLGNQSDLPDFSKLIKFKWPNDVLWGKHKIGGILLEEKGSSLVAGIGLNLISAPPASYLRENFATPAGSIGELAHGFEKIPQFSTFSMWQALVSMMRFWYESKMLCGRAQNLMPLIEPELAWMGQLVQVNDYFAQEKEPVKIGRILGLGSQGELRLLCNGKEELIVSGSICLA